MEDVLKKRSVIVIAAVVFAAFICNGAFAGDLKGKLGIGAEAGYYKILDKDIIEGPTDLESTYEGAYMFGATATYFFCDYFSTEFGIHFAESTMDKGYFSGKNEGEITQIPVLLTTRFHYPNSSIFTPYVGLGIGYYFNDYSETINPKYAVSVDLENALGFHVVAGAEAFLTDCLSLDVETKYVSHSPDFSFETATSTWYDSWDLDAFSASFGVKYYFDLGK